MELAELKTRLRTIEDDFDKLQKELQVQKDKRRAEVLNDWAVSNARFKVGDIIGFTSGTTIRVESFSGNFSKYEQKPYVTYYGPVLTKTLQPRKDESYATVYDDGRPLVYYDKKNKPHTA